MFASLVWWRRRYLRVGREGGLEMELGQDYLERFQFWQSIGQLYNYTFGLS